MISYDPFWETLSKRKITQFQLAKKYHVSMGTLDSIRKKRNMTLNTIDDLCQILNCPIEEIVRIIPDKNSSQD